MSLSLVAALALMQTAAPTPAPPPAPASDSDIVVRGKRTAAALAACIDRQCPTEDDVRLSIAHAESQFAEGKYRDARSTLQQSISRNRDAASRLPRHVAALHEAYSTVSLHYGDMDDYQRAMSNQAEVLRSYLPDSATEVQLLPIRLGDASLKRGYTYEARRQYRSAEREFRERGEHRLAAVAALRRATLDIAQGNPSLAREILREVDTGPAANDPAIRTYSAVLATRVDISKGDDAAVDRLLTALRTDPAGPPLLLDEAVGPASLASAKRPTQRALELRAEMMQARGSTPIQWADIGFMVAPDGSVGDVEVLRGNRILGWTKPIVEQVASRRYAPIALEPGHPGLYRVERFTLRASRAVQTGSIIKSPTGPVTLEILDLTRSTTTTPPA
ncbi:hypothetical protein [Sphingomonas qomolangmaensis]|uniref:TonB C-terminal domain-containing protein n=1 Tax=Sphingomonas qomolangmaensis TaxID=2918765 RepID=A0ABY5L771_9SPHN|nr:hypothetical protein [Sphingomonas qomolangmaensis]UUL82810.1 hypothetical protein NMP03_00765 [Sphingomonas qomolangmaensis]